MAADEPPYLTVGTDVSAKYKGAFCEAKIKKVSRIVKCKVTFKNSLGSSMIPDEQIRGTLRIGAEVEAMHPEKKQYLDAVINKMQDYSQYTVVFDDGDETTLRRTSLCLKSGRHFAESPTLDQFPLTNPEHFGTPVIGTSKAKRKRRSTLNSATLDYYSSDEDLIPKKSKFTRLKEKDSDVGKVVCVDFGDRRKKDSWYPGLIVTNSSHSAFRVSPKEEYLIRSFKDGKYNVVPKKDTREFSREVCRKVENASLRTATERALQYFEKGELPAHWDKSYFGLDMGLNEEDSHDTDTDSSDDEPSEEKDRFVAQLYKFMDERGTPINKAPTVGNRDLNLYKLFKVVHKMGGYNRVTNQNKWKTINSKMGISAATPSASNQIKLAYKRYLHSFEDFYRKLGCTMVSNSRSTRGRHRSDRNFIITRNRDRDTSSPKRKKEKNVEKKSEDKTPKATVEKKETKVKIETPVKSEEKPKSPDKKKAEKVKVEEKEDKPKPKKEENNKPRLVRSQSLNKDKKEKTSPAEKKETRNDRAKAREDAKKEKSESPEKKKETRSSVKQEQEREKREKEPATKKSETAAKESVKKEEKPSKSVKEEKTPKSIKEEKSSDKKDETSPKTKKIEKVTKEKEDKGKNSPDVIAVKDKKEKKADDPPFKEKKFEVIKMDKSDNTYVAKDKKERSRDVKPRICIELDEKPSRDRLFKDVRVQLSHESFKESYSKVKAAKEKEPVKEDSFVKILCDIREEKIPESDPEKDLFDFSSTSGRSGNDDDDYTPGRMLKKRRSNAEEKDDVKSITDIFDESDEELPGTLGEKLENKEVKAKNIEINDKVKVKYGHGRTQKVYEAKVLKIEMDGDEKRYYVHYAGWNTRYDEWVKKSFIVENISEHNRAVRRKKQDSSLKSSSPSSPSKKNERGRLPGTLPAAKLQRKNSTSSTNSSTVSSSRTTRSDKSGLHTSPFLKGLQPRKRTRKKSGLSTTFTDTSQDSESDEDDSMLMDDEEDDADNESEVKMKEDLFSDDEEIQLETFRKLPDNERHKADDDEEPIKELVPETPKSDMKSENAEKDIGTSKSKVVSAPEKKETPPAECRLPSENLICFPPTTDNTISFLTSNVAEKKDSDVPVPVLKKIDDVVKESPRSISELIEMKYVEEDKKESNVEIIENIKQTHIVDPPRKLLDDKMPPLITYMGSFDKVLTGANIKPKVESSTPNISQNTLNLSTKTKETMQKSQESKITVVNPPSACPKIPKAMMSPARIEMKNEPVPPPPPSSKGIYFPMFLFNSCNPSYSDPAGEIGNKSPSPVKSIQPFSKNVSPDQGAPSGITAKSKPMVFHESFQDPPISKEQPLLDGKGYLLSSSKGSQLPANLSSTILVPSSLSRNAPANLSSSFSAPTNLSSSFSAPTNLSSSFSAPTSMPTTISSSSNLLSSVSVATNLSSNIFTPTKLSSNISTPTKLSSNISTPTKLSSNISIPTKLSSNISTPTKLSSTISVPTNLSSNIPVPTNLSSSASIAAKKIEKKKNYDTVIHNMPNFVQREIQTKSSDLKLRTMLPEHETNIQKKPFEFPLTPTSKFRSAESQSKSPQIEKYFSSFSSVKTLESVSPSKSISQPEKIPEIKLNTENSKLTETRIRTPDSFLNKNVITDFDALRNSNFPKKEFTPISIKSSEVKETSPHTSVIAFASSATSNIIAPPISEIKKNIEIKEDFSPVINTIDIKNHPVKDSKDIKLEKAEVPISYAVPQQENVTVDSKINSPELLQQSLTELSIDEKGKELLGNKQGSPSNSSSSSGSICNVFLNVTAEKSTTDVKELFPPQKEFDNVKTESDKTTSVISVPKSSPEHSIQSLTRSTSSENLDSVSNAFENEKNENAILSKKAIKKKKSKTSKKSTAFDSSEKDDKPKESKLKSKKKAKFDSDDMPKTRDMEMKSKIKKFKKNKNKKRFSRLEDHEGSSRMDTTESGLKDASSEKNRKREKRREKKFSKTESKYDEAADGKGESPKKDKKKGRKDKEKMSSDKKSDFVGKKMRKKKKIHTEGTLDSDSEKESHSRLSDKKKKKDKKKMKVKDSSSSDDAAENRLLIDEEQNSFTPVQDSTEKREKIDDPDMSFLLCEEKVPASPVGANSLPDDTTGSSSLDDNSNNRSPSSEEDRIPAVNLVMYPEPANLEMLETINKRNAEACAVLDNTPPTTPSSSPASIPSSSPSHDREPFLHYTESTQSGRESCEGESDMFRCGLNRTEITEAEEYRAAATLAFAVGQSVNDKNTIDSYRTSPLKRQKSEVEDYSPSKHRKKSKRSYGIAEVSKVGNTRYKAASRSPRGESCDTYDSSNTSIFTVGSPPHGSSTSALCTSFSHHSSPQISAPSDMSSSRPSKSNFYLPLHEKDPEKRIMILQEKMTEMKKLYASLKAEVAQIDRRRKKARKKIREAASCAPANPASTHSEEVPNYS